jgi:hypothetical protein
VDLDVPAHHGRDLIEGDRVGGKPAVPVAKCTHHTEDGGARATLTSNGHNRRSPAGARRSSVLGEKSQYAIEVRGNRGISREGLEFAHDGLQHRQPDHGTL